MPYAPRHLPGVIFCARVGKVALAGVPPIGCGRPSQWKADAAALYDTIEKKIVPLYYAMDDQGRSRGWIRMMKEAMGSVAPAFSARRMMKDYLDKFYIPSSKMVKNIETAGQSREGNH